MNQEERIQQLMSKLQVRAEDIQESFVRSQGKGGQNVNKVETCVQLKHLPTGTTIKCQSQRSQNLNRLLARKLLLEKIENQIQQRAAAQKARLEKERRRKRGRSQKGKRIVREQKQWQTQKKRERRKMAVYKIQE